MISIISQLPQPILVPKCFIDWVKTREAANPEFSFVISLGENGDSGLAGWRMKNNVVTYNQEGTCYAIRILTGRPMNNRDLSSAIGLERTTLATVDPFYILPLAEKPRELISFTADAYDTLAELDKSYEKSKLNAQL